MKKRIDRNYRIDVLKTIAILLIILAHVCENNLIIQIRTFDVTLLVMISGYLAYNNRNIDLILKYYIKRIKRLILPTWIFLTLFFIIIYILKKEMLTKDLILSSYLLIGGIGYVWIIRIYLFCMIIAPLLKKIVEKYNANYILIISILIYIIYELISSFFIDSQNILIKYIVLYIIPYGFVYIIGMIIRKDDKNILNKMLITLPIMFLTCFIILYKKANRIELINAMKYPPRMYYISYGLVISLILFKMLEKLKIKENKMIAFISSSSLWIYLWHIIVLFTINYVFKDINWIIKYIIILILSVMITYIQNAILNKLEKRKVNIELINIFRG